MVHIGIIPDGNRRWCKNNDIDYKLENLEEIWFNIFLTQLREISINKNNKYNNIFKITDITFYVCSIENIKRNDNTSQFIYKFIYKLIFFYSNYEKIIDEMYKNDDEKKYNKAFKFYVKSIIDNLNIIPIGSFNLLPTNIHDILLKFKNHYNPNNKYNLYLGIAYDYNKDLLNYGTKNNKYYNREYKNIDIVVRTGGELRTSGFFPCDINYSEFYFYNKYWPEITINDFENIIFNFFNVRQRRFGK